MIHTVYRNDDSVAPELLDSMYKHRRIQFRDRLEWPVQVDSSGRELDEYDEINPLYLIVENEDGKHGGSMRFLPTTGDTMMNDHFTDLTGGVTIKSPFIWECTRFCLAPSASKLMSAKVLLATAELGLKFDLECFVGIFDSRMVRIYNRIGWSPVIIGRGQSSGQGLCVGLWPVSEEARNRILNKNNFLASSIQKTSGDVQYRSMNEVAEIA